MKENKIKQPFIPVLKDLDLLLLLFSPIPNSLPLLILNNSTNAPLKQSRYATVPGVSKFKSVLNKERQGIMATVCDSLAVRGVWSVTKRGGSISRFLAPACGRIDWQIVRLDPYVKTRRDANEQSTN